VEKGRKKDRNTKKYPFLFCLKRQKKFKFSQIHKSILFDLFLFVRFLAEGDRKKTAAGGNNNQDLPDFARRRRAGEREKM
jgi:hypothetical protein